MDSPYDDVLPSHVVQIRQREKCSTSSPTPPAEDRAYVTHPDAGYIPVNVVERQIEHARQHSQGEWEEMKPLIYKLYMEDDRALKVVMRILSEEYDFHATVRMYKIRFRRWGWRKNRVQDQRRVAERAKGSAALQQTTRIQYFKVPDLLSDQEVPISISRNYTIDSSGSQRWNCIVLNMSDPSTARDADARSMVRFCDAETAYVTTIHQLRSRRIHDAFKSLNALFDSMAGGRLYLHPKYLTGFWLLCHGIFNACQWINDDGFHLLRELVCFHGANAAACFSRGGSSASSHPIVSLMGSVARLSRDNPGAMKQTFRNAYRAAAQSLEEKLGPNHPIVLVTWTEYFWYFNFPYDDTRYNLVERQEAALKATEAEGGRNADLSICILHNFTFFLFYCVIDDAQARTKLVDLLQRTASRIDDKDSPVLIRSSFHLQRARAFASLLRGVYILQDEKDGDRDLALEKCEDVIGATIEWLGTCEGRDAMMHMRMLQMDLFTLTTAWKADKDLRDLTFAFAKPRSADYDDAKPRLERQRLESG
ncbi:hypothetical protein F5Y16DRAFT_299781 [Xylariaceae sp. FL0255]|nr:hypothetical protein F5Y16DRAFT_299781 [Xylariaceae sp. FL0255]